MKADLHKRKTARTAHFYTLGEINKLTKNIWIVFHGYGQLASQIITKFRDFDLKENFIVAPEGLSKFYWHDKNRDPVATWMTSHHRLDEIEDYINWISSVYDEIESKVGENVNINIFGFSQGCQTMWRWIENTQHHRIHSIIQWAGGFPAELELSTIKEYISAREFKIVIGNNDEYIKDDQIDKLTNSLKERDIDFNLIKYDGNHRIDRKVLTDILT